MKTFLFFLAHLSILLPTPALAALDPVIEAVDQRNVDSSSLASAALSRKPKRRALAASGFGQIMRHEGINPLLKLTTDSIPFVREAASFSLGQLGWLPDASGNRLSEIQTTLQAMLHDKQLAVRLSAAEALGKTGLEKTASLVAPALTSKEASLRAAAVMAIFRSRMILKLRNPESPPGELPEQLREQFADLLKDKSEKTRLSVAYFFARNSEPKVESALSKSTNDKNKWVRMFAFNGLAKMKAKSSKAAILVGIRDPEYYVRLAALGALVASGENLVDASSLVNDKSAHVRAALANALNANNPEEASLLSALSQDRSATVRAEALKSQAKQKGDALLPWLREEMKNPEWLVREAAVQASETAKQEERELFLQAALSDSNINVKATALEALGGIPSATAFSAIKAALESPEIAIRGTAIASLKDRKEEERMATAWNTYSASPQTKWVEMREEIVELFAKIPSDSTTDYLKRILQDTDFGVRNKARVALLARGIKDLPNPEKPIFSFSPYRELEFRRNPFVEIETNKGTFVVECFPKSAPIHVADFVGNVKNGYYDGLSWHRVVSNFVVQGGDPEGSGWGGSGYALRAEVNQVPFLRGALGMPRSQGFDTGGSQLFFSLVPTPHLDGQYTVFGQAIGGVDVIDRLERGDRILRARLLPSK